MELHTEGKTFKTKAVEIPSLSTNQKLAFKVRGKKSVLLTVFSVSWSSGKEFNEAYNR